MVWVFFCPKQPSWKKIDGGNANYEAHTICHVTKQVQSSNNTTHECKGLLTYNPMHDITSVKKHIDNEHEAIVAKYVLHPKKWKWSFRSKSWEE